MLQATEIRTRAQSSAPVQTVSKSIADWFTDKIERSRNGVFSEVVTLTPDLARLLLVGNKHNRVINNNHVQRIAEDIKAGKWYLNGEAIIVSPEGFLCTGQHRCHAVILSDTPVQTVMTFGVAYDTRFSNDQGLNKTVANYLSMRGEPVLNASICASAARILLIRRLGMDSGAHITKTRIQAEYDANKKAIDNAASFFASRKVGRIFGGPSMMTAALVLLRRIGPAADDFMARLVDGNDLSAGDPILIARDRFIKDTRMRQGERMMLIEKAFDAWCEGRKITQFQVKRRIDAGRKTVNGKPGRKS